MYIHVIQPGETLWKIAGQYMTDIEQIQFLNQLERPNELVVGQSIVIPDSRWECVVLPNDDLSSIANRYGVSLEDLIQFNDIADPSLLFVGQMLEIPYIAYMVQAGDSLWLIAQRFSVDMEEIVELNKLVDPSSLAVGQSLRIPARTKPMIEMNAFITNMDKSGRDEVLTLGKFFTYLSPFMYSIREDGTITPLRDELVLEAASITDTTPLLVLTNYREGSFDSDLAASILRDSPLQETLIKNLLATIEEKGYAGINIDFEYVYPEDRENYNEFLRRLVAQFHLRGLIVSTALAPKESADQEGLLYEAHDYKTQGEIVDFVVIMTYEWGWAGGRPRAISPIHKMGDVLDYAVTVIPPEKIMMGIPLYGRDWKIPWEEGSIARTVSPAEAIQLARRYGATIQYDDMSQSPFFRYTDETGQEHEVWFEDTRSVQAKYDLMKQYGLRGASYWVLGNPFPQNWPVLQSSFTVKK